MNKINSICFYRENTFYGEFSNFYLISSPIIYKGKSYKTSEHLYQALKYIYEDAPIINIEYVELIRKANTPNKAKILANQMICSKYNWQEELNNIIKKYQKIGVKIRKDWDNVKISVMRTVLELKFNKDLHCQQVLLSTGDAQLIENSPYDSFWGIGPNGVGSNMLGKLLMEIRNQLNNNNNSSIYEPMFTTL